MKLIRKIMYKISTHFINYLRVATLPQSTKTATAAMTAAPTGKNKQNREFYQ